MEFLELFVVGHNSHFPSYEGLVYLDCYGNKVLDRDRGDIGFSLAFHESYEFRCGVWVAGDVGVASAFRVGFVRWSCYYSGLSSSFILSFGRLSV